MRVRIEIENLRVGSDDSGVAIGEEGHEEYVYVPAELVGDLITAIRLADQHRIAN